MTKTTKSQTVKSPASSESAVDQTTAAEPGAALPTTPKGKLGLVVAILRRHEGATIAQMSEATGWQAHSVRGAISGSIKKKLGLRVVSEKRDAGRVYKIVEVAQ